MKPGCVHTCVSSPTEPMYTHTSLCAWRCKPRLCWYHGSSSGAPGADNIIIKRQYRADIGLMERRRYRPWPRELSNATVEFKKRTFSRLECHGGRKRLLWKRRRKKKNTDWDTEVKKRISDVTTKRANARLFHCVACPWLAIKSISTATGYYKNTEKFDKVQKKSSRLFVGQLSCVYWFFGFLVLPRKFCQKGQIILIVVQRSVVTLSWDAYTGLYILQWCHLYIYMNSVLR